MPIRSAVPGQRSEKLKQAQREALAAWFEGRRWRVPTERTSVITGPDGIKVVYQAGEFWVQEPGVFSTPTGRKGRHGFLLQEVDPLTGADIPGDLPAWGVNSLRKADALWPGCLVGGVPEEHPKPEEE